MKSSSKFFQNRECEYFPCHKCENEEEFNCLFCYCPLYMLGDECGGDFVITDGNIKDCSRCTQSHSPNAVERVEKMFGRIRETENRSREK